MEISNLVRPTILNMKPYSSARDEYKGSNAIFLDANENPYNHNVNRYPDPHQLDLKKRIGELKMVNPENIFLGNGSDEAIDLVFRIFCEPAIDNVITIHPTYGMYKVAAETNNIAVKEISLKDNFELDDKLVLEAVDDKTKVIFICSPNNPTGNLLDKKKVLNIIERSQCIVIVDEAYIDFSNDDGWLPLLNKYENLIVLQTFSKAWGMAGIRLGMAFASKFIISLFDKIKYPYNLGILTQRFALRKLKSCNRKERWVAKILENRTVLIHKLQLLKLFDQIYPTDSNFFLVKLKDPNDLFVYLTNYKVIVRDRSNVHLCGGCLRITVGSRRENRELLKAIKLYMKNKVNVF